VSLQEREPGPEPAAPRTALARGFRGVCPRCGEGALFARWARPRPACAACGLVYRREQGAMTGSMYLSAVATELLAAALVLGIFFATDWSPALSLAVSVPIVLVFSAWWLPRSIGLWVAVEYLTDVGNREPWVS
jgi:uncharacterized protein (DUF983 family)